MATPSHTTPEQLQRYYANMPEDGRYCGRCDLPLPQDLVGKRVVDAGCRRGKGVCKIADRVGTSGWVMGVDPVAQRVEAARAYVEEQGTRATNWPEIEFACAPFEDLQAAGLGDETADVVVVNNVLNVAGDYNQALREIARVLAPGGMLFHAGVFAEAPLAEDEMRTFAADGNVFGAARSLAQLQDALHVAGFTRVEVDSRRAVEPDGADAAPALAGRAYVAATVQAFV